MHFLSIIPISHVRVYIAAGAVLVLAALWILARYGRHRYVHIRPSEPVQIIGIQLGRIADAVDHLAYSVEAHSRAMRSENQINPSERPVSQTMSPPAGQNDRPTSLTDRHISMSMLGR